MYLHPPLPSFDPVNRSVAGDGPATLPLYGGIHSPAWRDARAAALSAMLDLIAEWRCATRAPRAAARTEALAAIRTFRRYHLEPERAAFAAAVGRNRRNEP